MNDRGPFDRILDSAASHDRTARLILIGMGVLGVLLLILVLPPVSLLSGGGSKTPQTAGQGTNAQQAPAASSAKLPKVPDGYEALSRLVAVDKPKGTQGPYALTVSLTQAVTDGRNLGLYTNRNGQWERLATATLINNGTAARAELSDLPANAAILRRVASAVQLSGWLPSGAQVDPPAQEILGVINPVDYSPNGDGSVSGAATQLPAGGKAAVIPTIRSASAKDADTVNSILAAPQVRDAHINALVQIATQPGIAGIDIDYEKVQPARKPDFTAFVTVLADRLHQASKTLTLTLPTPNKAGVTWDTGAYDWENLAKAADTIKIVPEQDPSAFYQKMTDVFTNYLKSKVDLHKLMLVVSRQSHEKGTDGLTSMSLMQGLTLASAIDVRTNAAITPNSSVVLVGKNIFTDDGAIGLHWDDQANAVSFAYPGRGGQRTVWLENSLSIAFKLDFARRLGLGGVALDDVSQDQQAPDIWDPVRVYADTGNVSLVAPNSTLLRPQWKSQAGAVDAGQKGNVVWKAPAQPGAYDVTLIVSDGVIFAGQKVVLNVQQAGSPQATPSPTPKR